MDIKIFGLEEKWTLRQWNNHPGTDNLFERNILRVRGY